MLESVNFAQNRISFSSRKNRKKTDTDETRILPNTLKTRIYQSAQKTESALIDYVPKGLRGDVNSNFYEFLSMGIIPYLAGSGMFMFVFNCINKYLDAKGKKLSADHGKKMALGVVLYGIFKTLSKGLVTKPVKWATGIDTEMPYQNKIYPLPTKAGEAADIQPQYQQRKVFDSNEFYRRDLLDKNYYDKVAKRLGLGTDLNDSVSETSPIIQNVVSTSNLAKSLASYSWAAVGVGLAVQDSWSDFFTAYSNRKHYYAPAESNISSSFAGRAKNFINNTGELTRVFGKSTIKGFKQLWQGTTADSAYMRHAGKGLLGFASALTVFLTANTIIRAKNMAKDKNKHTIDKSKESTVI